MLFCRMTRDSVEVVDDHHKWEGDLHITLEALRKLRKLIHADSVGFCVVRIRDEKNARDLATLMQDLPEVGGDPSAKERWVWGKGGHDRYTIARLPRVGEVVSYGVGSDCYVSGPVTSVGEGPLAVVKTAKHAFRRQKGTVRWVMPGRSGTLVRGAVEYLDPSF